ncbi:C6 transcription factor [Histoplasma capsulatum H143]|uniref:C6 transcription factor n=1 Tax=Ajellomyces capsulatus (strain H143) TaxID=544712 RepID=C6HD55_AJECH|nr:C6 transcription factor [Histoplasma capsulatum H143]
MKISLKPNEMETNLATLPERPKRVRRWHHRGFTGCSTCKSRHVRCDEAFPACRNCVKRGLQCDGAQGTTTFKFYNLDQNAASVTEPSVKRRKPKSDEKGSKFLKNEGNEEKRMQDKIKPPVTVRGNLISISKPSFLPASVSSPADLYYSHFINTVSTLLIVYDTDYNLNPYRYLFPKFSHTSKTLPEAMKALGALQIANTTTGKSQMWHMQNAMMMYGKAVRSLRQTLRAGPGHWQPTDLATCLLLCFFEMMDSETGNWKIHLRGVRDLFESMMKPIQPVPTPTMTIQTSNKPPEVPELSLKRFLISLTAYLDVAGAVSSNEGTVIEGPYWESHGGGWQYNLGVSGTLPEESRNATVLSALRRHWSLLMCIQTDISSFAKAKREGMPVELQETSRASLETRLALWRSMVPECFSMIDSALEDDVKTDGNDELLEGTACVEAYEKATIIYLHLVSVSGERVSRTPPPHITAASKRIITLFRSFGRGVGQLGMLWALYIAALEANDPADQEILREIFIGMTRFGFKNVTKALAILENAWLQKRSLAQYEWFYAPHLETSVLLP